MSSFNKDKKWLESKKVIGRLDWIEIISYYRFIGGKNIFVYVVGDGDKKQIVDIIDEDNNVLLLNKQGELEIDTYDNVTNSRKSFEYSDTIEEIAVTIHGTEIKIPIEPRV